MQTHTTPFDPKQFRNACGCFATGITIVTTEIDGEIHGMTANGFMSVSLDPALILVSMGHNTRMHELLPKSGRYAVSLLTTDLEKWSSHFAGWEQKDLDVTFERFGGQPVVPGAMAYFSAEIIDAHPAGDHTLYIAKVSDFAYDNEADPILFYTGKYKKMASSA
ncbi:MAG: flavin reductase family protein [Candidatus Promineifilaceae bacterium]